MTATRSANYSGNVASSQSFPAGPIARKPRDDKQAYKGRNVIERCYCRLKDYRRVATRYDKLGRNFFSGVCLAAAVAYWI